MFRAKNFKHEGRYLRFDLDGGDWEAQQWLSSSVQMAMNVGMRMEMGIDIGIDDCNEDSYTRVSSMAIGTH